MQEQLPISKVALPNHLLFPDIVGLLRQGHAVTLPAKGDSMYPFIHNGKDKVVLRESETYSPGDIVLASIGQGSYVLHRIYRIEEDHVWLMGDGNRSGMECCLRKNIAGKVIRIIRNGKPVRHCFANGKMAAHLWKLLLPVRKYLLFVLRLPNRWKTSRNR